MVVSFAMRIFFTVLRLGGSLKFFANLQRSFPSLSLTNRPSLCDKPLYDQQQHQGGRTRLITIAIFGRGDAVT
jgi:hypothetical protein